MVGIAPLLWGIGLLRQVRNSSIACRHALTTSRHMSFDCQLEADQFHILPLSIHERHEGNVEATAFACHCHVLHHHGHFGQAVACNLMVSLNVCLGHIDKLRVFDIDGIDRVADHEPKVVRIGEAW